MLRPLATLHCAAFLLWTVLCSPTWAIHPNHPQGFDPENSYQQGSDQIDQVDLFSGRLSVTLPIGPFSLIYNSNVWRYQLVSDGIRATPDEQNTAGLGWYLGWGEVYSPQHWYNGSERWLLVSDDGGRHIFYNELHQGEDDGDSQVLYSRDGSYLRLWVDDGYGSVDVEYPDGTTRRFISESGGVGTTYRLSKVWSRFATAGDPDLEMTYNEDDTLRTLTDRHGRNHYVHLTDELDGVAIGRLRRVITAVDVESIGGERAIFNFTYANERLNVSCKNQSASMPARIRVPHLVGIELPDGSSYSMQEDGELLYYNLCENGIEDVPGALRGVILPSGGSVRYQFTEKEFPPGEGSSVWNTSAGVERRSLVRADGVEQGVWSYRHTSIGASGGEPEVCTEVVFPTGDCTKYYFNGRYWITGTKGWERGLPFVYSQEEAGKYLSSQVFADHDPSNGACSGQPQRSTYLRFRHDPTPGAGQPLQHWYNTNRQIEADRTVYHDDGDRYKDVERLDFDGLGHFRQVIETDNFADPSTPGGTRITRIDYSRSEGTYPGTYVPIAVTEPWVLGIYDSFEVEEPDAVGETISRTEYIFDRQTGFLECSRKLASGSGLAAHDLVTAYEPTVTGQIAEVKAYGGDLQALSTTFESCDGLPPEPVSWLSHSYQFGALKNSRPKSPNGQPGPYFIYDVDLDPSTGTVLTSRDSAGVGVHYGYDAAGRLISQVSDNGSSASFAYTQASSGQSAKTLTTVLGPASEVFFKGENVLDDFGRVAVERRLGPSGTWAEKTIERNARGWVVAMSDWNAPSSRVEFLDFDPFGRARTIRPPTGPNHDVKQTFLGDREVVREVKRALPGGETWVSRTIENDGQGRQRRILEPSGPGGSMTPTEYSYDVGHRLTRIVSGVPGEAVQTRTFTYDNRGFLTAQTHPEKGPAGNGTVLYRDIDGRGLVHRVTDGPHDLSYSFDHLGRIVEVRDRNRGNRLVSELEYDQGEGFGAGKLWRSTQHNYLDLPFNAAGEEDVRVRLIYAYQGPGGQVSNQQTKILWSPGDLSFSQSFAYDGLGQVQTMSYPTCSASTPGCAGSTAATGPELSFTYSRGQVTSIPGFVDWIAHDAAGQWTEIYHANGVIDHQIMDSQAPSRIGRLFTTGVQPVSSNFDTGIFDYDGTGNISGQGASSFAYDEVGRLVQSSQSLVGCVGCSARQQFTYDRFGNLTSMDSLGDHDYDYIFDVDASTNRVTDCWSVVSDACPIAYDSAGNVTTFANFQFTYDTRNRLVRQAHLFYLYDVGGERVMTLMNDHLALGAQLALRDPEGRLLSKISYDGSTFDRDRDYVYVDGRLVAATRPDGSPLFHYHLDHLGTPRLLTKVDGSVEVSQDLLPFGHELPWASFQDNLKLTGHERDFSTGSDYMHARHYMQHLGRFMSVDPVLGDLSNPQRLNRYSYVLNDPINAVDPDGRHPIRIAVRAGNRLLFKTSIGERAAIRTLRDGGNVWVKTKSQARRLAQRAWGKEKITRHPPHGEGYYAHWQPKSRKTHGYGHVFYGRSAPFSSSFATWVAAGGLSSWYARMAEAATGSEKVGDSLNSIFQFGGTGLDEILTSLVQLRDLAEEMKGLLEGVDDETEVTAKKDDDQQAAEQPAPREEPEWPTLLEELRAGWSLRSLWDFGCMMNPTMCYRGFGGGPGAHGYHPYKY